jgi:site-specific recombinase XerD
VLGILSAVRAIMEARTAQGAVAWDLRTTGNTWLYNHGVDHLVRKALIGHSLRTGDVTDLYTKIMIKRMREAASVFDNIFAEILRPAAAVAAIGDRR